MEHHHGKSSHTKGHVHRHESMDGGHGKHAGHSPQMFRNRFFASLLLTLPILYYEHLFQQWFGYHAVQFPGSEWITPVLAVVIFFYGGWPFVEGARRELAARQPGMMTLVALAISVAFTYSIAVSLGLAGMPFYWELATLVDVMLLGHWMEMLSIQGASRALEHLALLVPPIAHRVTDRGTEDVSISELREGDVVLVRPGEQVPVDGVVEDGTSSVNEAFLTGESRPVMKERGNEVVAGAVNGEGALRVHVTRTGERTTLNQMMRLVRDAQASRSRFQALADRAAYWLTLGALGAGAAAAAGSAAAGRGRAFVVERAVAAAVLGLPQALGRAGRPEWAEEMGIGVGEAAKRGLSEAAARGESVIALMDKSRMLAVIVLADRVRDSAREAVRQLKEMGVQVVMVTGDAEAVAKTVAQDLRIERYHARVLPQDKSRIVRELRREGPVAFVGDGINDAPALLEADLGVAIGAGTNVAIESADLVLVENDPLDVVRALRLAKATYNKMVQNLFWATGYNAVAIPIAAGVLYAWRILLSPAAGALLMSLSTVIVAVNAMLLRRLRLA